MREFSKKSQYKDLSVKSLDEYVKLLHKYPSRIYFFRGENGLFREREAGAFREHRGGWKTEYRDFMDVVNDFYSEVSYRLDDAEKAHFLAFSQHYGIPTNLIDVSSSPLTALFFACSGSEPEGNVYVFDSEFIDVTSVIMNSPKKNFVELIVEKDPCTIAKFIELMRVYELQFPSRFIKHLDHLIDDIKHYMTPGLFGDRNMKELKRYKRKHCTDAQWAECNMFVAYGLNAENVYIATDSLKPDELNSLAFAYVVLAIHLLSHLHNCGEYLFWINWLPLMVYRPDILFERARIQHGFFIVQAFMHHTEPVYEVDVLARQRVLFEQKIRIENSSQVLSELDNIGINRASIFGDFDNIAKQIVRKYKAVTL